MGFISLRTPVPGPRGRAMLERRSAAVAAGLAKATDVVVDRAEGALIHDVDGNTFIDLVGGIGMLAVGHSPAPVVNAMAAQAAVAQHPMLKDKQFIRVIEKAIQEQVPPENQPAFNQRLAWLKQIAGK